MFRVPILGSSYSRAVRRRDRVQRPSRSVVPNRSSGSIFSRQLGQRESLSLRPNPFDKRDDFEPRVSGSIIVGCRGASGRPKLDKSETAAGRERADRLKVEWNLKYTVSDVSRPPGSTYRHLPRVCICRGRREILHEGPGSNNGTLFAAFPLRLPIPPRESSPRSLVYRSTWNIDASRRPTSANSRIPRLLLALPVYRSSISLSLSLCTFATTESIINMERADAHPRTRARATFDTEQHREEFLATEREKEERKSDLTRGPAPDIGR